jgi:hypothetical protein
MNVLIKQFNSSWQIVTVGLNIRITVSASFGF